MATISGASNERVYSITKWGGLNEHPDGDTGLKMGEASKMVNWKITRDGNLKRRPGSEVIFGLSGEFTAVISRDIMRIASFPSEQDIIEVYDEISTEQVPGKITVVGRSGRLEHGEWVPLDVSVEHGEMSQGDPELYTVSGGVLRKRGDIEGIQTSIGELPAMLDALAPDAWLYYFNNEATYAIRAGAVREENGQYILSGYLVSAVPLDIGKPVTGLWAGYAGGKKHLIAASDGKLWSLYDADYDLFILQRIGVENDQSINTDGGVSFIPFQDKVYILDGEEYWVYDGTLVRAVTGYVPLAAINRGPIVGGGAEVVGTLHEYANRLTPKRRVWLSPDGSAEHLSFQLPETGLKSIDYVKDLATDTDVTADWDLDEENGQVTAQTAPPEAENSYEVGYTVFTCDDEHHEDIPDYRGQVAHNRFAELYGAQRDTMICIYGDGTNRFLYSGMNYSGLADASYFPDMHESRIGDENTPITAMIRHGSALIAFKTNETWSCSYGQETMPDTGLLQDAFYIQPVSRDKGQTAPGQVRLVNNNPVTCSGTELYQWINSSRYTSNLTRDERQAHRISDRIQRSIKEMDFENCIMWDDDDSQEFYLVSNGVALIWNYAADVWYRYEGFDAVTMCNFLGEILIGTSDGNVIRLTDSMTTDTGKPIRAQWVSGAMDFGASHLRKYSSMMWVGLKPEEGTSVDVCVETDRKDTFREKVVSSTRALVPGEPFTVRTKIKAKKFVYYRLLLSVDEIMPAVTVTNVDFRVRQTGYAK